MKRFMLFPIITLFTLTGASALSANNLFTEPESGLVKINQDLKYNNEVEKTAADRLMPALPDPSTSTTYGCYYIRNYTWSFGGDGISPVQGKIRYPSPTCQSADGPPMNSPVVIFMHGNQQDHNDHNYLMAHLTRNGFVTASIANSGSNEGRATRAISYLNSLHTHWGFGDHLSSQVVFAGHSRGGEAAVTAARLIDEGPSFGAQNFIVEAVISLAPTDGGGSFGAQPRETLSGSMTRSMLMIYGSRDPDVTGSAANLANATPQETAFAIYDRAGSEFGSEGLQIFGTHLDKAMVFMHGVNHRAFIKQGLQASSGTVVGNNAAKAYFNSFLRWQVWGQIAYRQFFDGSSQPASLSSEPIYTQISEGRRRVIDNFENGDLNSNAFGGSVTDSAQGIITWLENDLHQLLSSSPHQTGGIRVTWSNGGFLNPYLRFGIPNGDILFVGPRRDFSSYEYLSLRVGQVYNQAFNTPGQEQSFRVRLFSGAGFSNKVSVSDYGFIPEQDEFICPALVVDCQVIADTDFSKSAMNTIRIPLAAFNNVDLSNVISVYLYFDDPGFNSGAIALDSLELVD